MRQPILVPLLAIVSALVLPSCGQTTFTPREATTATAISTSKPHDTPTTTTHAFSLTPTPTYRSVFHDAPDLDPLDVAKRLMQKTDARVPSLSDMNTSEEKVGFRHTFWIMNILNTEFYQTTAVLRHISKHGYWYVEDGVEVSTEAIRAAAVSFEQRIYPIVIHPFNEPRLPNVNGDPRITILHARIPAIAGYYSAADQYPNQVYPFSNQREMIYISTIARTVGSDKYLGTLTHELQHVMHWNSDPTEETWVNEGLSEVYAEKAGYPSGLLASFLRSPTTSLLHWPTDPLASVPYYGAANLFMSYLATHYGRDGHLQGLVQRQEDGIAGVEAYLRAIGSSATFNNVFADWIVAALLDQEDGPYAYPGRNVRVEPGDILEGLGSLKRFVPQYAGDYVEVHPPPGDVVVSFVGRQETPVLPVEPPGNGTCWWGNRGDSIDATLTGQFYLPDQSPLTLELTLWYDIEKFWDYAYVEVSTDSGQTWDILAGRRTSPPNPVGNGVGPGYTGQSMEWVKDIVDLSAYAGQEILLRFEYITDESGHGSGICIFEIAIPQMGWRDAGKAPPGFTWNAQGFLRIHNQIPQEYVVQVIEYTSSGPRVRRMDLDPLNRGEMPILGVGDVVHRIVVVVAGLAEKTSQEAPYTLELQRAHPD